MPKFEFKKKALLAAGVIMLLLWAGFDLYFPRQTDLREFEAEEVAHLDTIMWRSYYERERVKLFLQVAELLRTQFELPFLRSHLTAFRAARAAFVFKEGRQRADYEKALPDLRQYYGTIRKISLTPFDAAHEAQLELEWWIVHRERARHQTGDLEQALAEAAAELYQVPAAKLMNYAHLRTEAMHIRDYKAAHGGVSEEDWARIAALLCESWQSLWQAVQ